MNDTSSPLISIITVVYNGKALLEKTIRSVLEQTYHPIEFIIVDGGSNDGTLDIIKRYEKQISTWITEKDEGIYHAMNKGVAMASGAWICFLNCGDVLVNNHTIQEVVEGIKTNNYPDILYGNILVRTSDDKLKERIAKEPCNIHRMYFQSS